MRRSTALEGLTYRKEELEMAHILLHPLARRWELRCPGIALQQLRRCAAESYKRRRVNRVSQIETDGTHGSAIANTEAYRMNGVVKVLNISLVKPKGNVSQTPV